MTDHVHIRYWSHPMDGAIFATPTNLSTLTAEERQVLISKALSFEANQWEKAKIKATVKLEAILEY